MNNSRAMIMKKKQKAKPTQESTPSVRVHLELIIAEAREVFVSGSFNGWHLQATPMIAQDKGLWVTELVLPPGRYEYRFLVDGQWTDDPQAKEKVFNPYGGQNAVLMVRSGTEG